MTAGTRDPRTDAVEIRASGPDDGAMGESAHEVLDHTLRTLVPGFADYGFVHMAERDGSLVVAAARHGNPDLAPYLDRLLSGARGRMTAPGGAIDQVLRSGKPKMSLSGPAGRRRRPSGGRSVLDVLGPRSYVAVPMAQPDRLLGVLTLARFETEEPFQPKDLRVVAVVARQMAKLVTAVDQEAAQEEHIENLADQLIVIRESLAGELAAAREGLTRARREREASEEARERALEELRQSEEARSIAETALAEAKRPSMAPLGLEASLLDAVSEAVIATDLDGRIDYWNKAAERLYGWTRDEAVGRDLSETAPAVASSEQAAEAMAQMTAGEAWTAHIRAGRKDGTTFPAAFRGGPIYGDDGNPVGLVIVSSDLSREPEETETRTTEAGSQKANGTSRDDRKRDAGISLNSIVARLEPELRVMVGDDITFEMALDAKPDLVDGEARNVGLAITAVVASSKEMGTDVGLISIRTENVQLDASDLGDDSDGVRAGPYVAVLVQDDGVGTDRGSRQRVFENPAHEGTGPREVGLEQVRSFVEEAGGYMWVSSAPSQGTTVRMMFPRYRAPLQETVRVPPVDAGPLVDTSPSDLSAGEPGPRVAGEPGPQAPGPQAPDTSSMSHGEAGAVLLVEDDPGIRTLALEILRDDGHEVLDAQDGVEALRIWERERDRISMVLTDVVMPRMSGRALIDRLRTQRPDLPALFMSTYPDDAVALHGMTERRDPFIGKPFTSETLTTAVDDLLANVTISPSS